jgi:hypothetical protein
MSASDLLPQVAGVAEAANSYVGSSTWKRGLVDQSDLADFSKSERSKPYGDRVKLIGDTKYSVLNPNAYYSNKDNSDVSEIISAFNAWKAEQEKSKVSRKSYLDAYGETPGRDATILTGPAQSLLAGASSDPSAPAEVKRQLISQGGFRKPVHL